MVSLLGFLGAFFLSICAIPQATLSHKQKHSIGVSNYFLGFWLIGEILTMIYTLILYQDVPLFMNHLFNLICLAIIIYYKIFPNIAK